MSQELYREILSRKVFAVTGASQDTAKFGYKIFRFMKAAGYEVYAVNPNAAEVDGERCYRSLTDLPAKPDCVITVTPYPATENTAREAVALGIPYVWMQPGSESRIAIEEGGKGAEVISGGPCVMVEYNRLQRDDSRRS
jgi:uncharacterized protein